MRRKSMDWEKIFANDATNKGLIFKIYKHLIQFNNKTIKKWAEELNRHFFQKDTDGQQAHEKMLKTANY